MRALPEYNRLVLAYCEGVKFHSLAEWPRKGFVFMVRHKGGMIDGRSREHWQAAKEKLDMDFMSVVRWAYLEDLLPFMKKVN